MFLVWKGGLLLFIKNHNIQAFLYKLIDKVGAKNYLIQNIQKNWSAKSVEDDGISLSNT